MNPDDRARTRGPEPPVLPASLTIPIHPGGRVTAVYESTRITTVSLVYPFADHGRLIRFYDDALTGWSCSRAESHGSHSSEYSLGSSTVVVNLCVDVESDGFDIDATCVAITQAR